ncbi:hypothetical protein ECZU51_04590 [Escherichia coli]|nr:hypothetical protein ECZU51_04590 [Escherichia coli]
MTASLKHRRRPAAIERGIAGPGLLARVFTGKYCEHLPLYRQSEIFARQGVELSRALLSNWVDACCQLMTPLNDALYRYVMNTRKLHTDDTPVKVLAPGLKKTKTGRIWTYVRDDRNAGSSSPPAVWFAYSPNRQGKHPSNTSAPSGVSCRRMRSQVTTGCSVQNAKVVR